MMCFLTSDISISPDALRSALQEAVDQSFNMTMTEGDMSTNDTVIIMANGRAGNRLVQGREGSFQEGLNYVTRELAKLMAREGFSERFIEVQAKGASTLEDAREVARRIASSSILRVSFHGADPNWGHFVHAIGMADAQIDPSKITLTVSSKKGRVTLINKGSTRAYSNPNDATLKRLAKTMEAKDVRISVELGLGSYEATAWTCDLSVDYVKVLSRSMRRMLRKEARTGG